MFTGLAAFFAWLGTCQLVGAYRLNDPYAFIMIFFGASLMIMISAVMALGFVVRMHRAVRGGRRETDPETKD